MDKIEEKKKLIVKIIVAIVIIVIISASFIASKFEDADYENFEIENMIQDSKENEDIEENERIEKIEDNKEIEDDAENEVNNEDEKRKEDEEKIKVYVVGEVNEPGVVELTKGARIEDAIEAAGGAKKQANLKVINLAHCVEDEERIYVPNINEKEPEIEYVSKEGGSEREDKTIKQENIKVNINTGGTEELKKLPGVGDSLAQRIIDYRKENGNFKTAEDLKNVSGIGDKKFESMKKFIVLK